MPTKAKPLPEGVIELLKSDDLIATINKLKDDAKTEAALRLMLNESPVAPKLSLSTLLYTYRFQPTLAPNLESFFNSMSPTVKDWEELIDAIETGESLAKQILALIVKAPTLFTPPSTSIDKMQYLWKNLPIDTLRQIQWKASLSETGISNFSPSVIQFYLRHLTTKKYADQIKLLENQDSCFQTIRDYIVTKKWNGTLHEFLALINLLPDFTGTYNKTLAAYNTAPLRTPASPKTPTLSVNQTTLVNLAANYSPKDQVDVVNTTRDLHNCSLVDTKLTEYCILSNVALDLIVIGRSTSLPLEQVKMVLAKYSEHHSKLLATNLEQILSKKLLTVEELRIALPKASPSASFQDSWAVSLAVKYLLEVFPTSPELNRWLECLLIPRSRNDNSYRLILNNTHENIIFHPGLSEANRLLFAHALFQNLSEQLANAIDNRLTSSTAAANQEEALIRAKAIKDRLLITAPHHWQLIEESTRLCLNSKQPVSVGSMPKITAFNRLAEAICSSPLKSLYQVNPQKLLPLIMKLGLRLGAKKVLGESSVITTLYFNQLETKLLKSPKYIKRVSLLLAFHRKVSITTHCKALTVPDDLQAAINHILYHY